MKKKQEAPFGLRLSPDLKTWVKDRASREGRSANNLIVHLLSEAREAERQMEKAAG